MQRRRCAVGFSGAALLVLLLAHPAAAALLADAASVAGDSIARAFDANTSSCNYGDNVSRNFATGDDHGGSYCSAGGTGTYSHAERLECSKGGDIASFNDAASGADMVGDFPNQAATIRGHLSSAPAPRYVPVFLGHNDACKNTTSKTGNSCGGDSDPDNYCRATNAAFERDFRRGMDELIQIPSVRILVLSTVRVSELCNYASKNACGFLALGGTCRNAWRAVQIVSGSGGICASLTDDCSDQRRIDMYNTLVGYNAILEQVTAEYAAIAAGGASATGAVKAVDVAIRFEKSIFNVSFTSGDLSCCDCFHPSDQGHARLAEATWTGVQCSEATPCCATTGNPLTDAKCAALDTSTFYPGGFWAMGGCGNGIVDPGEDCDDGNAADGDCCSSSCQFDPSGRPCSEDGNVCTDDVCDGAGTCRHVSNTVPCSDGDACTRGDVCLNGSCSPGPSVACSAQDQCHDAGTCNPVTGVCSNPPKPNGTACSDGNACTRSDTCQAGFCIGANPVACAPADACHAAGTCDPASGQCSNPARPDGTPCSDGNACTRQDTCRGGTCTGTAPVVCAAADPCHVAGVCDPASGLCSNPAAPDGTACDDGDACTLTDVCRAGSCTGTEPVVCVPVDGCHDPGVCHRETGICSQPAKPDGAACNDGDACTQTDRCASGVCVGTDPVVCTARDQCHVAGTCNPATGVCSNPPQPDDTPCDDGNACTRTDRCRVGSCAGTDPVVCPPADQCHATPVCDPATGSCTSAPVPDGTVCDDGDACTRGDRCAGGLCAGPLGSCGDGVVDAACGEACDDGTANGGDACCSTDCRPVDGDGDGICDRDDPCTGPAPVENAKLTVVHLTRPGGDHGLKLRGDLPVAGRGLDPAARGVRLLVLDAAGATVVDAAVPGGSWNYATQTGWKTNAAGTTWKYRNGLGGIDGVARVTVRVARGRVRVIASGTGGYPVARDALPVVVNLIVDPNGACGTATFPGPAPAPHCALSATGATLSCR